MTVKPGGDSLLICSGARGDHGEIQTRYGLYPGVRNAPLTARIFILPTNDVNQSCSSTTATGDNSPYAFANGIRNTFDMAFWCRWKFIWCRKFRRPWSQWRNELAEKRSSLWLPMENGWYQSTAIPLVWSCRMIHWFRITTDHGEMVSGQMIRHFPTSVRISAGYSDTKFRSPTAISSEIRLTEMYWMQSDLGVSIGTFTAHRSPLGGLVFDSGNILHPDYRGDGFMLSWTEGLDSCGCTSTPDTSIGPFLDPSHGTWCILIWIMTAPFRILLYMLPAL